MQLTCRWENTVGVKTWRRNLCFWQFIKQAADENDKRADAERELEEDMQGKLLYVQSEMRNVRVCAHVCSKKDFRKT